MLFFNIKRVKKYGSIFLIKNTQSIHCYVKFNNLIIVRDRVSIMKVMTHLLSSNESLLKSSYILLLLMLRLLLGGGDLLLNIP